MPFTDILFVMGFAILHAMVNSYPYTHEGQSKSHLICFYGYQFPGLKHLNLSKSFGVMWPCWFHHILNGAYILADNLIIQSEFHITVSKEYPSRTSGIGHTMLFTNQLHELRKSLDHQFVINIFHVNLFLI